MTDIKKPEAEISYVSLVMDPYELKNIEISEAQDSSEPLTLDEPELSDEAEMEDPLAPNPKDDETLENISREINTQVEAAASEWAPDPQEQEKVEAAQRSAELLAAQIAEDQALQAELAKEAIELEEAQKTDPAILAALPQIREDGSLDLNELQSCIEAVLFMLDKPATLDRIRGIIGEGFELDLYQQAMSALMDRYQATAHGFELAQVAGGYQFRTKPVRAALAKKLSKVQTQRLSSGAMETLAIVAYRQPVLKDDIDKIRGVDSSYFVRHLLDRRMIQISGRSEMVGRPLVYTTTDEFLSLFGLKDLASMPSLREIEQMIPASQSSNPEDEDPRVKEMRRLVGQMKSDTSTSLVYDPGEDEKILQDIREKVASIPTSTPYLDEQKELEKQALAAAKLAAQQAAQPEGQLEESPAAAAELVTVSETAAEAAPAEQPQA